MSNPPTVGEGPEALGSSLRDTQPGASLTVLADLLAWIDAMTKKHGNPNGTDYEQGVNDHGFRIRGKVYALHEAAMIAATQQPAGEVVLSADDLAWAERKLRRDLPVGHCGESTSEAIDRGRAENRLDRVLAALSATQQPVSEGEGWRPIETAPKDGTAVDLWIAWSADDQRRIPDAFWGRAEPAFGGGVGEGWVDPSGGFGGECGLISSEAEALFWMPLPPAPSPIGEEKGVEG